VLPACTYRAATPADLERVMTVEVPEPVGWHTPERFRRDLAEHRMRPEWCWLAECAGRIVGRALWWGLPDSERPLALECLHVDASVPHRVDVAAALLAAGQAALLGSGTAAFTVVLAADWHNDPAAVAAVEWRREAVRRIGLTDELERLRFEWTPSSAVSAGSGRLTFSAEPDDDVMVRVFEQVARGSLDVETRRAVAALGPARAAREELAFYRDMPGERSWWRLARTADGRLAGLAIPSRTAYGPNVGYLGVVPELRGQGLVHDLLAEITRFHAEAGATTVTASTDTTNAPMAAAFAAAGYRVTEKRLALSAPSSA
jgi:GNAT superfamily N-acetyltransferase